MAEFAIYWSMPLRQANTGKSESPGPPWFYAESHKTIDKCEKKAEKMRHMSHSAIG